MKVLILFHLILAINFAQADDVCKEWFKSSKLELNDKCLVACTILDIDLKTFSCRNRCPEFCNISATHDLMFNLTDLYPGLTAAERALAAESPRNSFQAYQLAWKAESSCSTIFKTANINDESDACRHFIWAGLMLEELGLDFAVKVLNAHEADPNEKSEVRKMDLANNKIGLKAAEKLIKEKKFSEQTMINSFLEALKYDKFTILRKNPANLRKRKTD